MEESDGPEIEALTILPVVRVTGAGKERELGASDSGVQFARER